MNGLITSVFDFLKRPFNPQGNALSWVLWIGLILVAVWMWNHILMDVTKEL